MRYLLSLLTIIISVSTAFSQIDQAIVEWRSYLPYNEGRWVTQSPDKVYYSTEQALFSINKNEIDDVMFMSKVEGLTDVGIRRIRYDEFNDQLIVVYDNSNIDILKYKKYYMFLDVKLNSAC